MNHQHSKSTREQWGSKLGFILAAAGSAIDLGNIWRFSYVAGNEGGAAFVLIYLIAIAFIGYPLLVTEIAIGRKTQKSQIGAFKMLAPNSLWWLVGGLGVIVGVIILSFYSVISGWALAYTAKSVTGFTLGTDFEMLFLNHISNVWSPIMWHALFMTLTLTIIAAGVVEGIQKWAKILMPCLLIILLILVVRGLTLPGASEGIYFYLYPDFQAVSHGTFLSAIGQAFFTLSIGMGALITYGSYLNEKENISDSAAWILGLDTFVAILAGFAIFPTVFAMGFAPDAGAGLAFITLPAVFASMPAGNIFGFLFFMLLSVAALTSAICMLEVVVAWLIDEKGWHRTKAAVITGMIIFLIGIPVSLDSSVLSHINFYGMGILDIYDFIVSDILMPLGGMFICIFAGYVWQSKNVINEVNSPPGKIILGNWYGFLIKYVIPFAIGLVMVIGLIDKFTK